MGTFYKEENFSRRSSSSSASGWHKLLFAFVIFVLAAGMITFFWWRVSHNPLTMILDLNKASAAELEYLPGVGKVHAQDIINGRPYKTIEDIKKVPGIGERSYEKMKARIVVE